MPDRAELPPLDSVTYHAFVDPSGGSGADSMTLGIAHTEGDRVLLDVVAEVRPPFSPEEAVRQFAALCAHYRVGRVVGDRFGGSWPAERFGVHGLTYLPAEWPKSQIYLEVLPLFSGRRVELLDVPRLTGQLAGLERRTGRGSGRDLVDHEPCRHDDLANAACGALLLAARAAQVPVVAPVDLPRMSYWRRVGT